MSANPTRRPSHCRLPAGSDVLPFVYRITKYDPADRDTSGSYVGTVEAVSDHGAVESAYLQAVAACAEHVGIDRLAVREPQIAPAHVGFGTEPPVEGHGPAGLLPPDLAGFHDGAQVSLAVGLELVRAMLRDSGVWCRLEVEGRFTIHVGWDQYVYIGSSEPYEEALARTRALGLFPERLDTSPYDPDYDEPGEQRPADDVFWARLRWCVAERRAAILEEVHAGNAVRWHRLTDATLDQVRARLTPRAQLAVWPDLSTDVAAVLASLPEEGSIELVLEDAEGRITSTIADDIRFAEQAAESTGALAAAALSLYAGVRQPLFTAVLPDNDGVLRARWRTDPTPSDLHWALLKSLYRGKVVTGTVSGIADRGVTFVDIDGFTARTRPDHLSDTVPVGREVTAEVLEVDMVRERVLLSLTTRRPGPMSGE
ncbi:RNA-binding protein [Streptomyces sp. LBUM 1486]|nr:RNA-binding protein [Streptomyces sp. LBUM 1485]MBP5911941.1 RNA-binding protein [Streptomyces sp. LBUM 1486]QTU58556.1 RNA-binding protein [Streptomyces sp. LBUM 1480]